MWKICFLLIVTYIGFIKSQYPKSCPTSGTTCCPSFQGQICGGPSRGSCVDMTTSGDVCGLQHLTNLDWLTESGSITKVCACLPNFRDIDCGRCSRGYSGANCENFDPPKVVRKEFFSMTLAEQDQFFDVMTTAKHYPSSHRIMGTNETVSLYDFHAYLHYFTMHYNRSINYAHGAVGFPTWHRYYLLRFEEDLQDMLGDTDPPFAFPYWNWTNWETSQFVISRFGGDGDPSLAPGCNQQPNCTGCPLVAGPFADWKIWGDAVQIQGPNLLRTLGCNTPATTLPTASALHDTLYQQPIIYDQFPWNNSMYEPTFRNFLEGWTLTQNPSVQGLGGPEDMHNRVHDYVGGTMSLVPVAANDPIFFLHHAFVDSILEIWIRNNQDAGLPTWTTTDAPTGHNYDECMGGLFPVKPHSAMFQPSSKFGYTYDFLGDGPAAAPATQSESTDSGPSLGAAAGVAAAVAVGILIISIAVWWWCWRRRSPQHGTDVKGVEMT